MSRVRLRGISKRFGSVVAVDSVSIDVAEGEFVTLLGPSGCGKTTTLRMVAGLIDPSAGDIYFDEQRMNDTPPNRRHIGFVFQTHALFPHMTVADNIAFGLKVKGWGKAETRAKVEEMLALIELPAFGNRMPAQLSGGQQQRVSLARVLATNPRVLLFDEPLSGLDRKLRETMKYSIRDLQRKTGKTAIYVTHDQGEAFAISDRIFVMNEGRVEQSGTQAEIYFQPETRFVAEFVGANNALAGQVVEVSDGWVSLDAQGLALKARDPGGLAPGASVLAYVRPENIQLDPDGRINELEGELQRLVFEGATVRAWIDVGGPVLQVEVSGQRRVSLLRGEPERLRLGFDELTLIPAHRAAAATP